MDNLKWYNKQLLGYGYGSIPINTIFRGMNIHLPAILGFTRYQGFDPYSQTKPCFEDLINLIFFATGNKVIERQQNSGSEPNQSLLSRGAVGKLESARIHRLLWTWNPSLGGAAKLTCCDTCRGGRVPSALGPFRAQHYDQGGGNTLAKNISGG